MGDLSPFDDLEVEDMASLVQDDKELGGGAYRFDPVPTDDQLTSETATSLHLNMGFEPTSENGDAVERLDEKAPTGANKSARATKAGLQGTEGDQRSQASKVPPPGKKTTSIKADVRTSSKRKPQVPAPSSSSVQPRAGKESSRRSKGKSARGSNVPKVENVEERKSVRRSSRQSNANPKYAEGLPENELEEISDEEGDDGEGNDNDDDEDDSNADDDDGTDSDDGTEDDKPPKKIERKKRKYVKRQQPVIVEQKIETLLGKRTEKDSTIKYLVKWHAKAYIHCTWETEEFILSFYNGSNHLSRFAKKAAFGKVYIDINDDYFNPDYKEIDRILAVRRVNVPSHVAPEEAAEAAAVSKMERADEASSSTQIPTAADFPPFVKITQYFVKWCSLQYSDSTWESERFLDKHGYSDYIRRYYDLSKPPKEPPPGQEPPVARQKRDGNFVESKESPTDFSAGHTLRSYQLEGMNWLCFNWHKGRNSILADEMGLGKTVQSVSLFHYLFTKQKIPGPFLVVAPLSTVAHWQREIQEWTKMHSVIYHGSSASRTLIRKYEWDKFLVDLPADYDPRAESGYPRQVENGDIKKTRAGCYRFQVLITTYEIVLRDSERLSSIPWACLVVDEAHRLKNRNSSLFRSLMNFTVHHCVLLTGTPIQNKISELGTLLHFLEPKQFSDIDAFELQFGNLKEKTQVDALHAVLRPYLLRRMKGDVEKALPPREETLVEVQLTRPQKQYYKAIYEKNTEYLVSKTGSKPSLINIGMQLRKCCNHPFLLDGAEDAILSQDILNPEKFKSDLQKEKAEFEERQKQARAISINATLNDKRKLRDKDAKRKGEEGKDSGAGGIDTQQQENEQIERSYDSDMKKMIMSCGKLVLVDKLLPKLKSQGHRVLIFSQMVRVLDILEDYLRYRSYSYERLDGTMKSSDRQAGIDRFSKEGSDIFVFLLCTRAGGVGINLTAADTVIIYDSDWNPQNDIQAQARCHRIGQTKNVKVYRLITASTYESEMFHRASMKLGLDKAVLHTMGEGVGGSTKRSMKKDEVEALLKHGAYHVFLNTDESKADEFCEQDIDSILERNSRVVTVGEKGTELVSGNSTFSKATFVADEEKVDINDPEFWAKLGLKRATPESASLGSRKRTLTRRYGMAKEDDLADSDDLNSGSDFSITGESSRGPTGEANAEEERVEEIVPEDPEYFVNWSKKERDAFCGAVTTFGPFRWDEAREYVSPVVFRRVKRKRGRKKKKREPAGGDGGEGKENKENVEKNRTSEKSAPKEEPPLRHRTDKELTKYFCGFVLLHLRLVANSPIPSVQHTILQQVLLEARRLLPPELLMELERQQQSGMMDASSPVQSPSPSPTKSPAVQVKREKELEKSDDEHGDEDSEGTASDGPAKPGLETSHNAQGEANTDASGENKRSDSPSKASDIAPAASPKGDGTVKSEHASEKDSKDKNKTGSRGGRKMATATQKETERVLGILGMDKSLESPPFVQHRAKRARATFLVIERLWILHQIMLTPVFVPGSFHALRASEKYNKKTRSKGKKNKKKKKKMKERKGESKRKSVGRKGRVDETEWPEKKDKASGSSFHQDHNAKAVPDKDKDRKRGELNSPADTDETDEDGTTTIPAAKFGARNVKGSPSPSPNPSPPMSDIDGTGSQEDEEGDNDVENEAEEDNSASVKKNRKSDVSVRGTLAASASNSETEDDEGMKKLGISTTTPQPSPTSDKRSATPVEEADNDSEEEGDDEGDDYDEEEEDDNMKELDNDDDDDDDDEEEEAKEEDSIADGSLRTSRSSKPKRMEVEDAAAAEANVKDEAKGGGSVLDPEDEDDNDDDDDDDATEDDDNVGARKEKAKALEANKASSAPAKEEVQMKVKLELFKPIHDQRKALSGNGVPAKKGKPYSRWCRAGFWKNFQFPENFKLKEAKAGPPAEWWTFEDDCELIKGVYVLGLGEDGYIEMREHPLLLFRRHQAEASKKGAKGRQRSYDADGNKLWPSISTLNKRFIMLISALAKDLKRAQKDEKLRRKRKVKQVKSAWMFFSKQVWNSVKAENPEATFSEIGKKVGEKWKLLSAEEKIPFAHLHMADVKRYREARRAADKAEAEGVDLMVMDSDGSKDEHTSSEENKSHAEHGRDLGGDSGRSSRRESVASVKSEKKRGKKPKKIKAAKSAWMFFNKQRWAETKAENPNFSFTEICKQLSKRWRELDAEGKQPFIEMQTADQERYNKEIEAHVKAGGKPLQQSKSISKSLKKNKPKVKVAKSAWMFFNRESWAKTKAKHPEANFSEIGKLIGAQWKALTEEEKVPYQEQYKVDLKRYRDELKAAQEAQSAALEEDDDNTEDDEGFNNDEVENDANDSDDATGSSSKKVSKSSSKKRKSGAADSCSKRSKTAGDKKSAKEKRRVKRPRPVKSAWVYFSKQEWPKIKAESPELDFKSVGRVVSERWRALSLEEKQPFLESQKVDAERYHREKAENIAKAAAEAAVAEARENEEYEDNNVGDDANSKASAQGQEKEKSHGKKDAKQSKIKQVKSAWIYFSKETWGKVKASNPGASFPEIGKKVGELWKSLSADEKLPFIEKQRADAARYREEKRIAAEEDTPSSGEDEADFGEEEEEQEEKVDRAVDKVVRRKVVPARPSYMFFAKEFWEEVRSEEVAELRKEAEEVEEAKNTNAEADAEPRETETTGSSGPVSLEGERQDSNNINMERPASSPSAPAPAPQNNNKSNNEGSEKSLMAGEGSIKNDVEQPKTGPQAKGTGEDRGMGHIEAKDPETELSKSSGVMPDKHDDGGSEKDKLIEGKSTSGETESAAAIAEKNAKEEKAEERFQVSFKEISKKMGMKWKELRPEDKTKYIDLANKDRERYELEVAEAEREYQKALVDAEKEDAEAEKAQEKEEIQRQNNPENDEEAATESMKEGDEAAIVEAKKAETEVQVKAEREGEETEGAEEQVDDALGDSEADPTKIDGDAEHLGDLKHSSLLSKQSSKFKSKKRRRSETGNHPSGKRPRLGLRKSEVKKAKSAWMYFSMAMWDTVRADMPGVGFGNIGRYLGEAWKTLSKDEKAPYIERHLADKKRFEVESSNTVEQRHARRTKEKVAARLASAASEASSDAVRAKPQHDPKSSDHVKEEADDEEIDKNANSDDGVPVDDNDKTETPKAGSLKKKKNLSVKKEPDHDGGFKKPSPRIVNKKKSHTGNSGDSSGSAAHEEGKGTKKSKQKIRAPRTAYSYFAHDTRPSLRKSHVGTPCGEITKMVQEAWKALDKDSKQKYVEMQVKDRERYEAEYAQLLATIPDELRASIPASRGSNKKQKKLRNSLLDDDNCKRRRLSTGSTKSEEDMSSKADGDETSLLDEEEFSTGALTHEGKKRQNVSGGSDESLEEVDSVEMPGGTDQPKVKGGSQSKKVSTPTPTKVKKNTGKIKGFKTAWQCYSKSNWAKVKADRPNATFGELGKVIGTQWRALTAEEKKPYEEMSLDLMKSGPAMTKGRSAKKQPKKRKRPSTQDGVTGSMATLGDIEDPESTSSKPLRPEKKSKKDKDGKPKIKTVRSAWMFFSKAKWAETQAERPNDNFAAIGRIVGNKWKALSQEDKVPYMIMHKEDVERFQAEKKALGLDNPNSKLKKKKHKVRPATTAFVFYSRELRPKLKAENPDAPADQIRRMLSEGWRSIDPELKEKYLDMHFMDQERFSREFKEAEALRALEEEQNAENKDAYNEGMEEGQETGSSYPADDDYHTSNVGSDSNLERKLNAAEDDNDEDEEEEEEDEDDDEEEDQDEDDDGEDGEDQAHDHHRQYFRGQGEQPLQNDGLDDSQVFDRDRDFEQNVLNDNQRTQRYVEEGNENDTYGSGDRYARHNEFQGMRDMQGVHENRRFSRQSLYSSRDQAYGYEREKSGNDVKLGEDVLGMVDVEGALGSSNKAINQSLRRTTTPTLMQERFLDIDEEGQFPLDMLQRNPLEYSRPSEKTNAKREYRPHMLADRQRGLGDQVKPYDEYHASGGGCSGGHHLSRLQTSHIEQSQGHSQGPYSNWGNVAQRPVVYAPPQRSPSPKRYPQASPSPKGYQRRHQLTRDVTETQRMMDGRQYSAMIQSHSSPWGNTSGSYVREPLAQERMSDSMISPESTAMYNMGMYPGQQGRRGSFKVGDEVGIPHGTFGAYSQRNESQAPHNQQHDSGYSQNYPTTDYQHHRVGPPPNRSSNHINMEKYRMGHNDYTNKF